MSRVFDDLEAGRGMSDAEAELLVRWLWKLEGLIWTFMNPKDIYTTQYTLRQRVLRPIDKVRSSLVLAVALIDTIDPAYGAAPLGIDSLNIHNAIYVAGVFSRIAMMVLLEDFVAMLPPAFSRYHFPPDTDPSSRAKLFYPKVGFANDTEAVIVTVIVAQELSVLHDEVFVELEKMSSSPHQERKA